MPPDKNTSPSVKIVDVGPGKDHSSVEVVPAGVPPKAKEDVLFVPAAPGPYLAVAKSATSVQAHPFQDSVFATGFVIRPPNIKAEVCVPAPPEIRLAVFTSVVSVHDDPSQDSTFVLSVEGGL